MAEQNSDDKTEKATPKKQEETRKKGEVAKSREIPSVAVLLAGLATFTIFGSYISDSVLLIMKTGFSNITIQDFTVVDFVQFAQRIVRQFLLTLAPLLVAIFLAAVFSNVLQVGFLLSGEPIKPKFSKLNPMKGFGRMFSKQSLMEAVKSILKLTIVSVIAYAAIKEEMKNALVLGDMPIISIISYTSYVTFKIFLKCTLAMVVLAIIDYAFQKWEFENKNKMSKQEIKDENKRTDGDPQIKARIRSIQMEMARKRMMQDVPDADVVITNPTHLAVALKYDSTMAVPKLLAKGAGKIAERIKALAKDHDIPVVENKELARNLYQWVEIGQEIPPTLFQAVAEILAYIYKLKGRYANA